MKNILIVLLLLTTVISNSVFAVTPGIRYLGINYANISYNENSMAQEYHPTALIGRYGVNTTKYFSFEGRLGTVLSEDTHQIDLTDVTVDLDYIFGLYGIGHINIMQSSSIYAVLGITQVEATISIPGLQSTTDSESGFSYGIGTNISVTNTVQFNIEYMQYLDKSEVDLSALSVGLKFNF